ncbi:MULTISPECIES: polysaccharide deacetylase family protein [unclassified Streptomyces]|uniref:polysaccharide deacetylase family protein n=1 Tax=unclassified Streptomyces TaxID=2593676 RepID=UPI002E2E7D79|nr:MULTISPECIES: polysaccharide deacetylase family protein [unclassified Streptomyces]
MGFTTRANRQGIRAGAAVVAAAAAVAGTVWGVAALVEPGQGRQAQENVARQTGTGGEGTGTDDGAKGGGATGGSAQGAGGAPQSGIPDGIAHASESGGNAVNVTIDDGPDPQWTPKVLAVLKKYDVKATFCMIGPQAKAHPDLVKRVVAGGHRLCDHTVDHNTAMDKKPVAYQEKQILDAKKMIEDAAGGGAKVEYYRAPGGAFTPESRRIAAANGMRPLGWNVDTKDFGKPGVAVIVNAVKNEIGNGPTVLFHDGGGNRAQTVEALDQVLAWLKDRGRPTGFPVRTAPDAS